MTDPQVVNDDLTSDATDDDALTTDFDVAIVGTGPDPDNPTVDGFAMGYTHASGYDSLDGCEVVACADIVEENAAAFASNHGLDAGATYTDYETMLAETEPDVVSVCVPPAVHADVVVGCATSGVVDAIHCEKPMALTWDGARRMAAAADDAGVRLTFNHQRRFGKPFRAAKALLDSGIVGELRHVAYTWGNFYDNGTHAIDMCNYFNDERPAEWVIAQLDYRSEDIRFGTHNENQMLAQWKYDNGVYGFASTGPGGDVADADWRLTGTDGTIEVSLADRTVRLRTRDGGSETISYDDGRDMVGAAIRDVVGSLDRGETSELHAGNALNATEIIFAGYESVRRRGRVDLPLDVDDNPLEAMVEDGHLAPEPSVDQ